MKTILIFVRHAEAEGNLNRKFHGWTDSEITKKGHVQAELVAKKLKDTHIDILYSSSLKRTLQTAGYISREKNLPVIKTDNLKEINGGDWEDRTWEELPEIWPEEYDIWENKPHLLKMPNGETMVEFQDRLIAEVRKIAEENIGKTVCIVTHGTAIKALQCCFRSCSLEEMLKIPWQDNTAVTVIEYEEDVFRVIEEGDASHLGRENSTLQNQEWWTDYISRFNSLKE